MPEEGRAESPSNLRPTHTAPKRGRAEKLRLALAFGLGALAVVFAVLNLEEVRVHWIVGVWTTPLIIVIAVCLLLGGLIGAVLARRHT